MLTSAPHHSALCTKFEMQDLSMCSVACNHYCAVIQGCVHLDAQVFTWLYKHMRHPHSSRVACRMLRGQTMACLVCLAVSIQSLSACDLLLPIHERLTIRLQAHACLENLHCTCGTLKTCWGVVLCDSLAKAVYKDKAGCSHRTQSSCRCMLPTSP